jgi:hypothetical protein
LYGNLAAGFGVNAGRSPLNVRHAILGVQSLDVEAWKKKTLVQGLAPSKHETANLFFRSIEELEMDDRRRLFTFWTGLVALPPRGFEGLATLVLTIGGSVTKAATCYRMLHIPLVISETEMKALLVGLISDGGFTNN